MIRLFFTEEANTEAIIAAGSTISVLGLVLLIVVVVFCLVMVQNRKKQSISSK